MAPNKFQLHAFVASLAVIGACAMVVFWSFQPAPLPSSPAKPPASSGAPAASVKTEERLGPSIFESAQADTAIVLTTNADAFAPRSWTQKQPVSPPRVEQAITPVMLPAVAPPPTVSAPVLPFKYMGQMEDGGQSIIYLSRGEQTVVARLGEVLDQQYKITSITAAAVEFEITATGAKLALSIPVSQ
jgi:hypothetical protein